MDTRKYIYEKIIQSGNTTSYDEETLRKGIDLFCKDNAFDELVDNYSDSVIKHVVDTSIDGLTHMRRSDVILYLSNYELVEQVRVLNNRTLELALKRYSDGIIDHSEIEKLEKEFGRLLSKCVAVEGLVDNLHFQISEIILNIDYCKGNTDQLGKRLSDIMWQGR